MLTKFTIMGLNACNPGLALEITELCDCFLGASKLCSTVMFSATGVVSTVF